LETDPALGARSVGRRVDAIYLYELRRLFSNPWLLVDQYIDVVLGVAVMSMLIRENTSAKLTTGQSLRIGKLVQAQLHRQRMFTSCGWFFEQLDRPEPRYVIAQALRAIQLVQQATGTDVGPEFREALCVAKCGKGTTISLCQRAAADCTTRSRPRID
jgi:hypothetical protein